MSMVGHAAGSISQISSRPSPPGTSPGSSSPGTSPSAASPSAGASPSAAPSAAPSPSVASAPASASASASTSASPWAQLLAGYAHSTAATRSPMGVFFIDASFNAFPRNDSLVLSGSATTCNY